MVEHRNLTGDSLHEPKGVDSAADGTVYVANGVGTGAWSQLDASSILIEDNENLFQETTLDGILTEVYRNLRGGWEYHVDNGVSPQIFDSTGSVLQVNGASANTITTFRPNPHLPNNIWQPNTSRIQPIVDGEAYLIRIDIPISSIEGSAATLIARLDISNGAIPSQVLTTIDTPIHSIAPLSLSLVIPTFCTGDFLTNGGRIFLSCDKGSVTVEGPSIYINKTSGGL